MFKLIKRMAYLGLKAEEALEEERKLGCLESGADHAESICPVWPVAEDGIKNFEDVKKLYFKRAWELTNNNYAQTAKLLGVAINTLRKYVDND